MKRENPRLDVATRKSFPKNQLLRLVKIGPKVVVDKSQSLLGRGYYLHKDEAALELALRRHVFERLFHRPLSEEEIASLKEAIHE